MAKKGKLKVSKVKRNNQTTNKMKKQGKMKLQRHRAKIQKQHIPQKENQVEYSSESEASADEWGDMLDEEEKQYIMTRLAKNPRFLTDVPEKEDQNKSNRKRKKIHKEKVPKRKRGSDSGAESESGSGSDFEDKYEKEMADRPAKRLRALLPIKTKQGLMERTVECDHTESEQDDSSVLQKAQKEDDADEESHADSDSGMEGTGEEDAESSEGGVVSTVELLAARRDKLNHEKLRIGALCSSLLEDPEKKLKNLYPILYLMEERLKDNTLNLHSVRKLATLSAYEVFKDILPEYQIRHQDYSNVKLKKETLALYKYEKELLEFYKRYLQRLEKACAILRPKKGDNRKPAESAVSLGLVALRCLCGLLAARPHFNYATNIAQSVVPFLAARAQASDVATDCCVAVFAEDTRGDITLTIVRLINQLVKRRGERLRPAALRCLLSLRIRDVDLDAEADVRHKKKQDERHKKRIVNLSKKEKKRAKKLKEVERELLETEAQESEAARRRQLTEVTKTVFHIYFRLLKAAPGPGLLAAALDGLAKFTHVINLEYYSDLVSILSRLLEAAGARERLLCVRCALAVLAGAGDALRLDPARFHAALYADMLAAHAGATLEWARLVLQALTAVRARARAVSGDELAALAKRLATLALQLPHNGALACLALLHTLAQQSKVVAELFELDAAGGAGRFDPLLASPAHAHARASALAELCALRRHYHPAVRDAVDKGPPSKLTPIQLFDQYDGSQMAFKPAVPPPRAAPRARAPPAHPWAQPELRRLCQRVEDAVDLARVGAVWPVERSATNKRC